MVNEWKVLAEIMLTSEKIKPSQDAKRRVLRKYNLLGTFKDRKITKAFYEIFRRQGIIDKIILKYTGSRHINILDPWLRSALRIAIYYYLFYKKGEENIKEILEEWIRENTHPGCAIQFREILKEIINDKDGIREEMDPLELEFLVPRWFAEKMIDLLGKNDAVKLFKKFLEVPKISIRVNILKAKPEEIKEILERKYKKKVEYGRFLKTVLKFKGPLNFDKCKEFREGKFIIQDEASALASVLLDPKPGNIVVDMCAAPGGKTEHIAELMKLQGKIYAFDIDEERIKRMREILERTGTNKIVKIYKEDARRAFEILGEEFADKVLLDVPCTSDGTLAKNPELRWRIREEKVKEMVQLQKELLDTASKIVKVNGEILYCTCSMLKEEDEDVIEWFLKTHPNFELVSLPEVGSEGSIKGTRRMFPHLHDTIGFFYAKLKRIK